MSFRRSIAVIAAKIIQLLCRMSGRQGVTLAGKIALQIYPGLLTDFASQVKEKIIIVCGTNGKTTTNNLLCSFLESEGKRVVCNHTGSNMLNGIASAFILHSNIIGRLNADYACMEIDEASAVKILPYFKPDLMILTNLFRDQLDRYGEIDITMRLLKNAMDLAPDMELLINGDDALSAYLAEESGHKYYTFGISERVNQEENTKEIREGRFCKKCGHKLEYEFYHFSQMGIYRCTECGFARPVIDFDAAQIEMQDGITFVTGGRTIHTDYRGFYNIYNILAAYAAGKCVGLEMNQVNEVLGKFKPENGRNEKFHIDQTDIILNLAKNPAGFNQNISAVMTDQKLKDIIIVINDNDQDGTDVSWLWDVDFDALADASISSIVVSGIRCQDMRLRLKYVGISSILIGDVTEALEDRIKNGCGNLYVLVNYTALYSTHVTLKNMERR